MILYFIILSFYDVNVYFEEYWWRGLSKGRKVSLLEKELKQQIIRIYVCVSIYMCVYILFVIFHNRK